MHFGQVRQPGSATQGTPDIVDVVFSRHQVGPDDGSPLRMVSERRFAELVANETTYLRLLSLLAEAITAVAAPK